MKEAPGYAIVYDLSDDRERGRVARLLQGYGFRVQQSVFECRLTRSGRETLLARLQRLALRSGSVKLYRIYGGTEALVVGKPMVEPDAQPIYAF